MPQASDELRAVMKRWFGDPIDEGPPADFLLSRGYTERGGMWTKPTPSYHPSDEEVTCLLFLRDEWDHDFHKPLFPPLPHEDL